MKIDVVNACSPKAVGKRLGRRRSRSLELAKRRTRGKHEHEAPLPARLGQAGEFTNDGLRDRQPS